MQSKIKFSALTAHIQVLAIHELNLNSYIFVYLFSDDIELTNMVLKPLF